MLIEYSPLTLAADSYAVITAADFRALCRRAGAEFRPIAEHNRSRTPLLTADALLDAPIDASSPRGGPGVADRMALAAKLIARRRAAGLSQADLARRAAVRVETLNRIERGRTNPDFATMRKLAIALRDAGEPPDTRGQRRKKAPARQRVTT